MHTPPPCLATVFNMLMFLYVPTSAIPVTLLVLHPNKAATSLQGHYYQMPRPTFRNSDTVRHILLWEWCLLLQFSTRARTLGALIRVKVLSKEPDVQVRYVDEASPNGVPSMILVTSHKTCAYHASRALSVTQTEVSLPWKRAQGSISGSARPLS